MLSHAIQDGRNLLRFRLKTDSITTGLTAGTGDLPLNTWYHAAATYDGTTMRLYVNGVEVGRAPKTGAIAANAAVPVDIGRSPDGTHYLSGTIDDVRVYRRALTAAEIAAVMSEDDSIAWKVAFTASADHGSSVTRYLLEVFASGADPNTTTALATSDLGKPAPDAIGEIVLDRTSFFEALAPGNYMMTVSAIGAGGSGRSSPYIFSR